MITKLDLEAAIAECQGERNPNANTCIKLAAFYTIRKEMFGEDAPVPSYSFAAEPTDRHEETVSYKGETEFARLVDGKSVSEVMAIVDELMSTLQVLYPRLYAGVINELNA